MSSFLSPARLALLAVAAFSISPDAAQARECQIILCSTPSYVARWSQLSGESCDYPPACAPDQVSGLKTYLIPWTDAPSPAFLNCEPLGTGYLCEAWPQSEDIHYEWSISGGAGPTHMIDPSNPFLNLTCFSNMATSVAVTVMSPYGQGVTATRTLQPCGGM